MTYISKRLMVLMLGGMLAAGVAVGVTASNGDAKPKVKISMDDRPVAREGKMSASFAPIVKKAIPSVVKVSTTYKMKQQMMGPPSNDPFFRYFFGDRSRDGRRGGRSFGAPEEHGIGSGVIVTKDGYILTNNHVVDDADELKVTLSDGREFKAKVIGKDAKSDVAVIKIDATDLPAIEIADSDKCEVGDVVLAIGNPFGLNQTVTMGIISALDRGAVLGLGPESFIQTDAAINVGNSGGALVDAEGRLIGINTAIFSQSGGNVGIGFAIPTAMARNVMESLIQYGKVTRGILGVYLQPDLAPEMARQFKAPDAKGALITEVTTNSPAEKAGLKAGDIITAINDKPVADSRHLSLAVSQMKPGDKVTLKILRDGDSKTVNATIGEDNSEKNQSAIESESNGDQGTLNGVGVDNITDPLRQQLSIPENIKGAVITEVDPTSAAAEAGLKTGDVILEINHTPVKNADEAVKLTEKSGDKTTLLRLWSNGRVRYVLVDESKK